MNKSTKRTKHNSSTRGENIRLPALSLEYRVGYRPLRVIFTFDENNSEISTSAESSLSVFEDTSNRIGIVKIVRSDLLSSGQFYYVTVRLQLILILFFSHI